MRTDERQVLVPAAALVELINLVDLAIARLDALEPHDALQPALRGAVADIRVHAVPEPCLLD